MVNGIGYVICFANRAEAFVGPQCVDVDTRIRCNYRRGRLINICFPLQVHSAAAYISHAQDGFPEQLPLHREIPVPCFWVLERLALRRYHQRQGIGPIPSWIIHTAERHARVRLERRIPAKEDRVTYTEPREESASPGAYDSVLVDLIRHAYSRLDIVPLNIRVMVWNPGMEQCVVQSRARFGNAPDRGGWESRSRNDHAVVELLNRGISRYQSCSGIHCDGIVLVVDA